MGYLLAPPGPQAVHLCIDMQRLFEPGAPWATPWMERVTPQVAGGETDVCVLASVLAAIDIGYRVIVAEDALCSSADESHDALLELYAERFSLQIEVAPTASILQVWRLDD
jgi:hypothetical protein